MRSPAPKLSIQHPLLRYGLAVGAVALALLLTILIRLLGGQTIFALFFLAVIASTWYGGLGAGLLAILLSVVLSDLFLLSPIGGLSFDGLGQLLVAALTALVISVLT